MAGILRVSEAGALALHSAALLACSGDRVLTARRIAAALNASHAHLAKVLQRLVAAGLVDSARGPKGGFSLAKPITDITLLDVYEAIEGPAEAMRCLFDMEICDGDCMLGGVIEKVNRELIDCLRSATLASLVKAKGKKLCALLEG